METYAASVLDQVQLAGGGQPLVAYVLVAVGTALFGNLFAFPAILLGLAGTFGTGSMFLTPVAALVGQLLGDITWYSLGRSLAETRAGSWLRDRLPTSKRITRFFENGSVYVLIVSKLLTTPTSPILFLLGWNRTPAATYARLSLISAAGWAVGMMLVSIAVYSGIRIFF